MRRKALMLPPLASLLLSFAALADSAPPTQLSAVQVDDVIGRLKTGLNDYVFPDVARAVQRQLQAHRSEYRAIRDPVALASRLTSDMRAVGHDRHLQVSYGEELGLKKDQSVEQKRAAHAYDLANGFGFRSARRLPGNIGYIDIAYFSPDPDAGAQLAAAMQVVAGTDALIIDLRRNGGGSGEMAATVLSYFFDEPVELSSIVERRAGHDTVRQKWTSPYVAGPRYLAKPIYILVSVHTHSAAEFCAYDLKNLHRATLVGERTSGDANSSTGEIDLGDGFAALIPNGRTLSPLTNANWEGVGVQPDVVTSPGEELTAAYVMALKAVGTASGDLRKERDTALANPQSALLEELDGFITK
jgi:retinol-binding protein 3